MKRCCEMMQMQVEQTCEEHPNLFDCPDHLICFSERSKQYGIIVHDRGTSFVIIHFCPWCGARLSAGKESRICLLTTALRPHTPPCMTRSRRRPWRAIPAWTDHAGGSGPWC